MSSIEALIIEDDEDCSLLLQETLMDFNICSHRASSLREGQGYLLTNSPDLFVLDVSLNDGNGFALCEYLRSQARFKDTPVVFVSGMDEALGEEECEHVDGSAWFTKPLDHEKFAKFIHSCRLGCDEK